MKNIVVKNLSLNFDQGPFFVDVSLQIAPGKLHTLSGKNGSGKSTFLAALRGNIPCQGTIEISGVSYALTDGELKRKIIYISQRYDEMIADRFSFRDNLRFAHVSTCPSLWRKLFSSPSFPSLLDRFEIDYERPARLLSGGQRQILALLMALQKQPQMVLLDEPTATLDATNARMVFQFLRALMEEVELTALVICHDHELVDSFRNGSSFNIQIGEGGVRYLK
jgi:ABC-type multidrug transport system ATPase subunit